MRKASDLSHLIDGHIVEVKKEKLSVVHTLELVNQMIELLPQAGIALAGQGIQKVTVHHDNLGHGLDAAMVVECGVEGDPCDPGLATAVTTKGRPAFPEGTEYLLVKVAEVFWVVTGIEKAYPHQCALALLEHGVECLFLLTVPVHTLQISALHIPSTRTGWTTEDILLAFRVH